MGRRSGFVRGLRNNGERPSRRSALQPPPHHMSLIRIAVPGQPVILVDEGPNTGRTSFSRGAISGGAIVATASWRDRLRASDKRVGHHGPKVRPHKRDDLAGIPRPVCGKTLRIIGEPCARTPRHGWDCKSAEDMARRAADRRTNREVGRPAAPDHEERRRTYKNEWQRERRARAKSA